MHTALIGDNAVIAGVRDRLRKDVPLGRTILLQAWDNFFQDDYRGAIIHANSVIELVLGSLVKKALQTRQVASGNRIDRFVEATSNRLLATVVLSLLGIGDPQFREQLFASIETRHSLIHRGKGSASASAARIALESAERLLLLLLANPPSASFDSGGDKKT
jgi:hypothetical protein